MDVESALQIALIAIPGPNKHHAGVSYDPGDWFFQWKPRVQVSLYTVFTLMARDLNPSKLRPTGSLRGALKNSLSREV